MNAASANKLIGKPLNRVEDARLIRGQSNYVSDLPARHLALHMAIARSPEAHAQIIELDLTAARKSEGVVAILTAADIVDLAPLPCDWAPDDAPFESRHPLLAKDRVLYFGQPVAAVIAETKAAADLAAQLITLSLSSISTILDQELACASDAPILHEGAKDNICFSHNRRNGDVDGAFLTAAKIVKRRLTNNRVSAAPLEGRAVLSDYDPVTGQLKHHSSSQLPHVHARALADCLNFPQHKLHFISPDVGGGFGAKLGFYAEDVLAAAASMRLHRPVFWAENRTETYLGTTHGRDHVHNIEMAIDATGRVLGLRGKVLADIGAYAMGMGPGIIYLNTGGSLTGPYKIENVDITIEAVYSNRMPTGPYRGAGHPEASYMLERMMDEIAYELGLDPILVRKNNFVSPQEMPYNVATGSSLDSGDFAANLDKALSHIDVDEFRRDQTIARKSRRYLGMGIGVFSESSGAAPSIGMGAVGFKRSGHESARVVVHPDGRATVFSGSHSQGQGHHTSLAQIAGDTLGLALEDVKVVQGDTAVIPFGTGTFNSRTMAVGGTAVFKACKSILEQMRQIAATKLQVRPYNLEFLDGAFRIKSGATIKLALGRGTARAIDGIVARVYRRITGHDLPDRGRDAALHSISFAEIASEAHLGHDVPPGMTSGLDKTVFFDPKAMPTAYATHISVVEINGETGQVTLLRHIVVDDCGQIINPLLATGQVHGGIAQGAGQALMEQMIYDADGQLFSENFATYAMPRAHDFPDFETGHTITSAPGNPLGVKGIGEGGAIGAPPAIINAALDALRPEGVRDLQMPLLPMNVWRAIQAAKKELNR